MTLYDFWNAWNEGHVKVIEFPLGDQFCDIFWGTGLLVLIDK